MQNRIATLILVVIAGIIAGVAIVKNQAKEPMLREVLQKQDVILQAQGRIEQKMGGASGPNPVLLAKVNDLEVRLSAMETELKNLKMGGAAPTRQAPPAEDPNKVYDIVLGDSPIRGNKDAAVTIVEFVDFECPFCARFHPPVTEVLEAYPKDVNYVLKNFPLSFHKNARMAAKAAFAAGEQGKYWEMADALLENGKSLSEEKIKELAGQIGLNVDKFVKALESNDAEYEKRIQDDMSLAAKVGVRGTPTFYINGKKTRARDFNSFKAEIDKILSEK